MVQYVHNLRNENDDKRVLIDTWLGCSNIQLVQVAVTTYQESTNTAQLDSPADILLRRLVERAISGNDFSNVVINRIRKPFVTEVVVTEVIVTEVDESDIEVIECM
jgi:hypothetical protein